MSYSLIVANGFDVFGPGGYVLPAINLAVACGAVRYGRYAQRRGWFR